MDNKWLEPNLENEEDKTRRVRIAKERNISVHDIVAKLDEELAKKTSEPPSVPASRTTPKQIIERPDPKVIAERPTPRAIGDDDDEQESQQTSSIPSKPDAQVIELIRLYYRLNERNRLELLMLARVKAYLDRENK